MNNGLKIVDKSCTDSFQTIVKNVGNLASSWIIKNENCILMSESLLKVPS